MADDFGRAPGPSSKNWPARFGSERKKWLDSPQTTSVALVITQARAAPAITELGVYESPIVVCEFDLKPGPISVGPQV